MGAAAATAVKDKDRAKGKAKNGKSSCIPIPAPRLHRHALRTITERNALVLANTGLVYHAAKRFAVPNTNEYDDYAQSGFLGLINAAELYDPGRRTPQGKPIRFSTYATWAILHAMIRAPHHHATIRLPDGARERGVCVVVRRLTNGLVEQMAWENSGVTVDAEEIGLVGRDAAFRRAVDDALSAVRELPERMQMVVYRWMGGDTLVMIGEDMGVSKQRVQQLFAAAVKRLRRSVGAE